MIQKCIIEMHKDVCEYLISVEKNLSEWRS